VGQRLGIDAIAQWSHVFGLGMPSGIELENEKPGLIPDSDWKRRRFHQPWYSGETLSAAIGQGYVTVTPLQMAGMIAAVASGQRFRPHFVEKVEDPNGALVARYEPESLGALPVKKSTLTTLREALRDVVQTDRGTGKKARLHGVEVAGKTGTAQVVKLGATRRKASQLPRNQRDHAWFVTFAPVDDPEIAIATLVEHADGGGGAVAAPAAKVVLEAYFALRAEREGRNYADVRSATVVAF